MSTVHFTRRRTCVLAAPSLATLATLAAWPLAAWAAWAAYPERPIKLVVPYPAGGATDVIGRVVAQKLALALGQPVVVDNRAGAAGNLGAVAVAKENADGYTLLLGALTSHSINSVLAPAATPPAVIARLSAALKEVMATPEVKDALAAQGAAATYTSPDEARAAIRDEVARWSKIVREAGIKPD